MQVTDKNIEYFGVNVGNGELLEEKTYYHWTENFNPLPGRLSEYLFPFDVGIRSNGKDLSYSCFFPLSNSDIFFLLLDYFTCDTGILLEKDPFISRFFDVADLIRRSHYDPIVSLKYSNHSLVGVSFYVTALREKARMNDYLDKVLHNVDFAAFQQESLFIREMVLIRFADMFQVSWDFTQCGFRQNKVYLKIKDRESFTRELLRSFPSLFGFIHREGFRFCELAFVLGEGIQSRFNLYFKPL